MGTKDCFIFPKSTILEPLVTNNEGPNNVVVNNYLRKVANVNGSVINEADMLFDDLREVFGLFEDFNSYLSINMVEKLVKLLIEIRGEFRKEKNWAMSDKIRDELKAAGVSLEDTPKRILWKLTELKD